MSEPSAMQPLLNHACPLCGAPNDCAAAREGRFDVACWCSAVVIDAQVLARVPPPLRGKACLCRACACGATSDSASR